MNCGSVIFNILSIIILIAILVVSNKKSKQDYKSFIKLINVITISYIFYFISIVYTCFSTNDFSESRKLIIMLPLLIISIIYFVKIISIFKSLDKSNISTKKNFQYY